MNTLEKLQKALSKSPSHTPGDFLWKHLADPITCKDGSTLSVQASENHYCTPRSNFGPYTEVEVWNCGEVPAWSEYGNGDEPYAYIPIELVVEEIDRRGGIA